MSSSEIIERIVQEVVTLRQRVAALETLECARIACLAFRRSPISIESGIGTMVGFDAEVFDYGGLHDTASNNSRLTVPVPGIYIVAANVHWAVNNAGSRRITVVRNGAYPTPIIRVRQGAHGADDQFVGGLMKLAANDYLELEAFQSSGAPLGFEFTDPGGAWFAVALIG